ncbi:MAG: pyridoxamine 5'-phosphate oxidase [Dermatophilaceae bacterium]
MATDRRDYEGEGLLETDLAPSPLAQVQAWVEQAQARHADRGDAPEPLSMAVATVDADGLPNVRAVLLRFLDERGLGFVTNTESAKAAELAANPAVAATLVWPAMFRAIRVRGLAEPLDADEVLGYFTERPWGSRVGAWASRQSQPVADRAHLDAAYDAYAARYPDRGGPQDVPVPPYWGGYRIRCQEVELWAGRSSRLHDRLVYASVTGQPADLGDPGAWRVLRRQP